MAELKDVQGTIRSMLLPVIAGVPLTTWGFKAGALGLVVPLPALPLATWASGIAQSAFLSAIAGIGVGLVLGTAGFVAQAG